MLGCRYQASEATKPTTWTSSVARLGGYSPSPIGLPTKTQNKENAKFLALLRLSFALE